MSRDPLKPEHLEARVIRALSGLTQAEISEDTGISQSLIAQFEQGTVLPGKDQLERLAGCAEIDVQNAEELLRLHRGQRRTWLRRSDGAGPLLDSLALALRRHCADAFQRLLKIRRPARPPAPEDRRQADERFAELKRLSQRSRLAVVKSIEAYQGPALAERCREESARLAPFDPGRAASWARVALEIDPPATRDIFGSP
jgi:transcriptional regulator with XRE-family HTH domain